MRNAAKGTGFRSPTFQLFNLKWELELYPNGGSDKSAGNVVIYLCLCALSPNVKSINVKRKYTFVEGNAESFAQQREITRSKMFCSSWKLAKLTTTTLQKFNEFTFKVDVTLYNAFDINGKDITNNFIKNDEYKKDASVSTEDKQLNAAKLDSIIIQIEKLNKTVSTMQQKMNNLELRMDEEQKNNDSDRIDKLVKEMKTIKQTMSKLSLNNYINPEQQKLKSWLENKVKLPQYYDVFLNNGIDELSVVAMIDKNTLKDMGIDTIGHQVKILNYAKQLNKNNNNVIANEGGPTAYI
eukprot:274880_1